MFTINDFETQEFEKDLKAFSERALPFATRSTINTAAFTTRRLGIENARNSMTLRNKFTERSIRVKKSQSLNIQAQTARVGSVQDYMRDQEFGKTNVKKGKQGVRIPTSYASGEGLHANPRKRVVRPSNRINRITLRNKQKRGKTRAQQNLIAVKEAAGSKQKFVFMDLGRRKGIFKVLGGKKNPRVRMVHDLTEQSVTIPPNPWLKPATNETVRMMPTMYRDALKFQLRRLGLFSAII
jgi:hypothetical protein